MNLQAIREEFPITQNYIFLNHASVAPLPTSTVGAIEDYLHHQQDNSYVRGGYGHKVDHARRLAADLIGASPDEVAFTKSTSEGISFVANGLKWNAGDNIVTCAVEFPSNMYPWMNLQSRGVQIRTILEENGRIQMDNRQHIFVEKFAVVAGVAFVVVGLFGTNGTFAPESANVPMLLFASMMFLSAYLMSLIVRIGNRHSVWPWVDPEKTDR